MKLFVTRPTNRSFAAIYYFCVLKCKYESTARNKNRTCLGLELGLFLNFNTSMFVIMQCFIFQASCRGEVNECYNGGTNIWDPVKSFACLCKKGYEGVFCEKGNTYCLKKLPYLVQSMSCRALRKMKNLDQQVRVKTQVIFCKAKLLTMIESTTLLEIT